MWRNTLHSLDRYKPALTAIRVTPALKTFCQCCIEDKSKHTRSNASCIHMHCKPVAPSSLSRGSVFRTAWTFFYLCQRDAAITPSPTTMFHSWLVWLSASALAEMSSQASPSEPPGWPPSPSPPARSYHLAVVKFLFKAVRLCLPLATRVIRGYTPYPNFLWKTAKKSVLVLIPRAKDCTSASIFWSLELSTSHVIAQSKIDREVGRCHDEREGRINVGFLQTSLWGKTSRYVKVLFWVYLRAL